MTGKERLFPTVSSVHPNENVPKTITAKKPINILLFIDSSFLARGIPPIYKLNKIIPLAQVRICGYHLDMDKKLLKRKNLSHNRQSGGDPFR